VGPLSEEPVDWSLRFAARGFRAGILDSVSRDVPFLNPWTGLLQRRRWIKGQTECLFRSIGSLSGGRALLLAVVTIASNFAVLLILPVLLASPISTIALAILSCILALELLRIAGAAAGAGRWRERVPKRGWLLLLPWEIASSLGYWLGFLDWCTGRTAWDRARE